MGLVNIHAGKLPFYRGRSVVNWAIINGETEVGITAHMVDEGFDTGDILLQDVVPVGWTERYGQVLEKVQKAVPSLATRVVDRLASQQALPRSQRREHGTYFPRRGPGDELINWNDTSRNLHNFIRALAPPAPGARTFVKGKEVIIWRAFYDPSWPCYIAIPGQVVGKWPNQGALVKTADSTILVQEIQLQNEENTRPTWPIGLKLGRCGSFHQING
jgi:methionyl-tRNA formyltransferase